MISLTPEEEAILRPEYNAYVARCNDTAATMGRYLTFPMSFDDWWRHTADEAKDRAKYQDHSTTN